MAPRSHLSKPETACETKFEQVLHARVMADCDAEQAGGLKQGWPDCKTRKSCLFPGEFMHVNIL